MRAKMDKIHTSFVVIDKFLNFALLWHLCRQQPGEIEFAEKFYVVQRPPASITSAAQWNENCVRAKLTRVDCHLCGRRSRSRFLSTVVKLFLCITKQTQMMKTFF
jgi:hypothetical protein